MSDRHGTVSSGRRGSVSSSEVTKAEIFFWVRSELFEYGLLPFSPHSDISFTSLLAIVRKYRNTHELNAQYLKAINTLYSTNASSENVSMRYVKHLNYTAIIKIRLSAAAGRYKMHFQLLLTKASFFALKCRLACCFGDCSNSYHSIWQ